MAASSTTLTRPSVSFIAAKGVTAPGSMPSVARMSSAEPNEKRPEASSSRCSDLSSITASSSAVTRQSAPFLSLRNRFLVWPPGIVPRSACDSSTVNSAGCVTVLCAMLRRSRKAKRSAGVAGMGLLGRAGLLLLRRPRGRRGPYARGGWLWVPAFAGTTASCVWRSSACWPDIEPLIDRREHLIEARQDHDLHQPVLAPLRDGLRLQIVRHHLPRHRLRQDGVRQCIGLRQRRRAVGADAIDHLLRQAGGARMCDVVVPLEAGAGGACDREHDELIDRARQRAFELEEEAELLDAAGELWMVEQREIGAAEAFALRLAARRHRRIELARVGGERRGVHVQHGHGAFSG